MIKVTIKLDKRYKLSSGKYPVKLAIARNGKTLYVPLNMEVDEKDWDKDNVNHVKNRSDKKMLNTILKNRLSQAELTIQDLQMRGLLRRFDNKRLVSYLLADRSTAIEDKFSDVYKEFIDSKEKVNTIEAYNSAVKLIKKFCDYDELSVHDITAEWINSFKSWIVKNQHLSPNTAEIYTTRIRTVYNSARNKGIVTQPFPRTKSLRQPTAKRSLLTEQLRELYRMPLTPVKRKHRDVFFLIFMMRGINMADLSALKADAIQNGRIVYVRRKTGKTYNIKIEPEMLEIINKYKGKKHLLYFFDDKKDDYYKCFGSCMRLSLRSSAKMCGITEPISSYWARHSWSSVAIEIGTELQFVSAGLGHSMGNETTQIYIQYRQKQIDDISRRVIDCLLKKGDFSEDK